MVIHAPAPAAKVPLENVNWYMGDSVGFDGNLSYRYTVMFALALAVVGL